MADQYVPTHHLATGFIAALMLSACAVAPAMTDQEKEVREYADVNQFMPATREMRQNIETQELFAQAAFWSREYELNPSDLEAAIKLSATIRKLGNPGRAVEITQVTRALYPKDPYLLAEHAAALIADERAYDAIPVLDQGLAIAPQYGRLWSLKGAALDQSEQYQAARQHYARALQITPNDANVLANVGLSHALSGDPKTAETWLRRAAAQPNASAGVRQNLALVLQLQGKQQEAEQQTRLSKLSRGDRKFPPPPVPAHTPRTAETLIPSQPPSAPLRGSYSAQQQPPSARLSVQGTNGEVYPSASEAALDAKRNRQSQSAATTAPQPFGTGPVTTEQQNVLDRISQSLNPQAQQSMTPQSQTGQAAQHVVGANVQTAPSQPMAAASQFTDSNLAGADTRRKAARKRR